MFLISAVMLISTGVVWVFAADSSLASWNQPKISSKSTKDEEMETLKKSPENNLNTQKDDGTDDSVQQS